jgi:hypothetical protein
VKADFVLIDTSSKPKPPEFVMRPPPDGFAKYPENKEILPKSATKAIQKPAPVAIVDEPMAPPEANKSFMLGDIS